MYKSTHRALAKAVREGASSAALDYDQTEIIAVAIADVCEAATPKTATFDREVFLALACQQRLPVAAAE
jgi:hypothetical protein